MIKISNQQAKQLGGTTSCPNTHWIEIELIDESGDPSPGERYELRQGDGVVSSGSLNDAGFAREEGLMPGTYDICFPEIDAELWKRL